MTLENAQSAGERWPDVRITFFLGWSARPIDKLKIWLRLGTPDIQICGKSRLVRVAGARKKAFRPWAGVRQAACEKFLAVVRPDQCSLTFVFALPLRGHSEGICLA